MTYKNILLEILSKKGEVTHLEFSEFSNQHEMYFKIFYRIGEGSLQVETIKRSTMQRIKKSGLII